MNIKIHSIHFDADTKLLNFIEQKIKKLPQYYDDIIGAEVFLRLENVQGMENKIAEIKLFIPGNDVFAKKQSKTFEEATDECAEALVKQLKKHKEKLRS
ncbi:MAG: ribosome-associated translation inhibitor RaiA [Bacteroidales bacterium]|nr:ribosome-associated translation inhibitor RaiA [Bacteroidales bacterium]MCB9000263.1 ribosome-associated translation inhibitor RaiA [Bacteroidales bacterium]MCB9013797.1 ribosome-associated translation inhibitor RaiA [Bacteroidales bacterium]